jgi:hypothetical protein
MMNSKSNPANSHVQATEEPSAAAGGVGVNAVPVVKEENIRIQKRAAGPYETAIHLFTTTNYKPIIDEHNNLVKKIKDDPLTWYFQARERLQKAGATASFPEFKGTVALLTQAIFQKPEYVAVIEADETLKNIREIQVHSLIAIQTQNRYMWPYKATIMVIEELLKIVDIISRRLRKEASPKYYHNFRYRGYLTYLLDEAAPQNIVFPTVYPIGSTFLIEVRCAPIYFLGVVTDFTHADQYDNSPLDFWAHDIQHARRLIQEDRRYYDIVVKHELYYLKRSPFDYVSYDDFSIEMYKFSKILLNIIKFKTGDSEKIKAYKQIKKMLIFEVVHEKAWPITKFSLCRNIPLGYDIFPIESLVQTENGAGMKTFDDKFQDPTTLSNLYHKLRKGFYDKVDASLDVIVNPKYRTARDIATAAKEFLEEIGCVKKYTIEKLLALTQDPIGAEEFTERAATIAFPNDRNEGVLEKNPTEKMPIWQVEVEAPVFEGGFRKSKRTRSKKRKSLTKRRSKK